MIKLYVLNFSEIEQSAAEGGMSEMCEWILRVRPTIKPLVYFWRGVFRSSDRLQSGC